MTFVTSGLKQSTEELVLSEGQRYGGSSETNSGSRMWTIKVKSRSERTTADRDLGVLTNEQYRECLGEADPVQVETIVSGDRVSAVRLSTDSTRSTLDRHFSFGRSRRGSEALLDVEIPPRGTLNDQPELSQTVTVVQEKGSIFQRFLRYLPCLLPLSLALIDAPATGPQDSSFTRTVTRLSLKNFFLSALLRSARIVTSNTSIESTPPLPSLSSLLSFTTTP
jgi:hypothetical protein